MAAIDAAGNEGFDDYSVLYESYVIRPLKKKGDEGHLVRVKSNDKEFAHPRPINVLQPGMTVVVGNLFITPISVDHSVPGALGFIIRGGDKTVVYTGDLRFHGLRRSLSESFVEAAKDSAPDCLICEGTRIDKEESDSEEGVKTRIEDAFRNTTGLVLIEYTNKDLDRVQSILDATKACGRELVITTKLANMITALGPLSPISIDDVKILIEKKSWGLIRVHDDAAEHHRPGLRQLGTEIHRVRQTRSRQPASQPIRADTS